MSPAPLAVVDPLATARAVRTLALVLSDGDARAASASVSASARLGLRAWIAERQRSAGDAHLDTGAPVVVADWDSAPGAAAVADVTDGCADWLVVLAAGEALAVDHPGGLAGALAGCAPGPVLVEVPGGAEVRIVPPGPGMTDLIGGAHGELVEGVRIVPAAPSGLRLHLGCGPNRLEGWVNVDLEAAYEPDIVHDLSQGLPAEEDSVDFVYSEHFWEHLHIEDGVRLMAHCRRALRPGGVLRIAMPDLAECVRRYLGDWRGEAWIQNPGFAWIDTPARMLNACFREWGHQYLYDAADVEARLRGVGFSDVRICAWGESEVPELRGLETRPESLLVVEAVK